MKICPKCGKTYTDESLNFCLEDGSILKRAEAKGSLPETMAISQQPPFGDASENRSFPAQINNSPQKTPRTWLWVVGIFAVVIVVCGGSLTGLFVLGKMSDNRNERNANFGKNSNYNSTFKTNVNAANASDAPDVKKVDLSAWVKADSQYGTTEFRGNELIVSARQNDFYYVLVASGAYKSTNSTTKISVRDVAGSGNSLGYGLVTNSNPSPLIKDYAFLINARTGKYRVVAHASAKEKTIVNWKNSATIKGGSEENILEVREEGEQFKFFINGTLIETLSGKDSYRNGVPGIYVGGASPVAFANLEIRK